LALMRQGEPVARLFTWANTDEKQEKQLLQDFEKWEREHAKQTA